MHAHLLRALTSVSAAIATLAAGIASASAATTYTVTAGTAPSGTSVQFVARAIGALPRFTFTDTTTGTIFQCDNESVPGASTVGTGRPGNRIATLNGNGAKWDGCNGFAGLQFDITGIGTWFVNATSGGTDAVNGTISNVSVHLSSAAGCAFDVTGAMPFRYNDNNQVLTWLPGGDLVTSNVVASGCFGLWNNNDQMSFEAKHSVTATTIGFNPIAVTSP